MPLWMVGVISGLVGALPWVIVATVTVGLVTWSPLGRGLLRHLRTREEQAALHEAMIGELIGLRESLNEALERLDATERRMGARLEGTAAPVALPPRPAPPEMTTPT